MVFAYTPPTSRQCAGPFMGLLGHDPGRDLHCLCLTDFQHSANETGHCWSVIGSVETTCHARRGIRPRALLGRLDHDSR